MTTTKEVAKQASTTIPTNTTTATPNLPTMTTTMTMNMRTATTTMITTTTKPHATPQWGTTLTAAPTQPRSEAPHSPQR
eukprot:12889373-Prorocentrum_lima.AAC.1